VNQSIRKIISSCLLAIFLVAIIPDDLLHLLANHHDTVESNSTTTSVSARHIHCEALQLSLPSFSEPLSFHFSSSQFFFTQVYFGAEEVTLSFFSLSHPGRAPPALA